MTTDALRMALKLTKEGGSSVVAAVAVLLISKANSLNRTCLTRINIGLSIETLRERGSRALVVCSAA